jgi:hypothetical protein
MPRKRPGPQVRQNQIDVSFDPPQPGACLGAGIIRPLQGFDKRVAHHHRGRSCSPLLVHDSRRREAGGTSAQDQETAEAAAAAK